MSDRREQGIGEIDGDQKIFNGNTDLKVKMLKNVNSSTSFNN